MLRTMLHLVFILLTFKSDCVASATAIRYIESTKFLCNCEKDQCLHDGTCKPNFTCREGYFGYACQYSNVLYSPFYPEISDNSYDTCVSAYTLFITSMERRPRYFRISVTNNSDFKSLSFSFSDYPDVFKSCDGIFLLSGLHVIDYHCKSGVIKTGHNINLTNVNKIPICHIAVSSGRNLVLSALVHAPTTTDLKLYSTDGLTDGITEFGDHTCYLGPEEMADSEVLVLLPFPIVLSAVEIFDLPPDYKSVGQFTLEVKTLGKRSTVASAKKKEENGVEIKRYQLDIDLDNVVQIALIPSGRFGACEIKLVGDCPPGKHGLSCQDDCPGYCDWCTLEGVCLAKRNCSHCVNGACDKYKYCQHGCIPGYYGKDCNSECSPNCVNGICDQNKVCQHGCYAGYYGQDCNSAFTLAALAAYLFLLICILLIADLIYITLKRMYAPQVVAQPTSGPVKRLFKKVKEKLVALKNKFLGQHPQGFQRILALIRKGLFFVVKSTFFLTTGMLTGHVLLSIGQYLANLLLNPENVSPIGQVYPSVLAPFTPLATPMTYRNTPIFY